MKINIMIITIMFAFLGCINTNNSQTINEMLEEIAIKQEEHNQEIYAWEANITEIYVRSNQEFGSGIRYLDSLLQYEKKLTNWRKSHLNMIAGELYYGKDSLNHAFERFNKVEDSPRLNADMAGCFAKLHQFDTALVLLQKSAEINNSFYWHIGNLHEMMSNKEKAIDNYMFLYKKDTSVYDYCKQRIDELNSDSYKQMTEIQFRDRSKRTIIMLK